MDFLSTQWFIVAVTSGFITNRILFKWQKEKDKNQQIVNRRRSKKPKLTSVRNFNELITQDQVDQIHPLMAQVKFLNSPASNIINVTNLAVQFDGQRKRNIITSPLLSENKYRCALGGKGFLHFDSFIYRGACILGCTEFNKQSNRSEYKQYLQAGPRRSLHFQPKQVVAAIVTCGGLCPGLNAVVRDIVLSLTLHYGVKKIYGIRYGYCGFYKYEWIQLDAKIVSNIHTKGGTFLGSSRGGFDKQKMVDALIQKGVNQLYILGGDGTHRGIQVLYQQLKKQHLNVAIVGVPKTIDNDIPIIDMSFGFQTAVSQAIQAIRSAYVQSTSADYGIGLVRLMGRSCGWIAMHATNAARVVDICLIPQFQFNLYGSKGLFQYILKTIQKQRHMVIVVAQGAGDAVKDMKMGQGEGKDKSGNKKMTDIGAFLKKAIVQYAKQNNTEITLKYIDPTYMIRSIQPNAADKNKCGHLAQAAVHGAMAGFTNFTVGHINDCVAMIPLQEINKAGTSKITRDDKAYARMLANTLQPSFLD